MKFFKFLHAVYQCLYTFQRHCVIARCTETTYRTVALDTYHTSFCTQQITLDGTPVSKDAYDKIKAGLANAEQKLKTTKEKLNKYQKVRKENDDRILNVTYFEWRLAFPDLLDNEGRFVGFDCIVGNPPYIRLQDLKNPDDKEAYSDSNYITHDSEGDIYCLFYELGYQLLRDCGLLGYITSNKWMRADYGQKLRGFFVNWVNPILLVDFGTQPVFNGKKVDANIMIFEKTSNKFCMNGCWYSGQRKGKDIPDVLQRQQSHCRLPQKPGSGTQPLQVYHHCPWRRDHRIRQHTCRHDLYIYHSIRGGGSP